MATGIFDEGLDTHEHQWKPVITVTFLGIRYEVGRQKWGSLFKRMSV